MSILSNNIYEVLARRKDKFGYDKVNVGVKILSIEKAEIPKQDALSMKCSFIVRYFKGKEMNAEVIISENILLSLPKRKLDSVLKEWEKNGKISDKYKKDVLVPIEFVCGYDAHIVTNKMMLPPPVKYDLLDQ